MNSISFLMAFTAISSLLFAYYYVLLRKERHFQRNRIFLLSILPLSVLLPLLEIDLFPVKKILPAFSTTLETITITSESVNNWAYQYDDIFSPLYIGICLVVLLIFIIRLIRICMTIFRSPREKLASGAEIVFYKGPQSPASFGPYIFWDPDSNMEQEERNHILAHELCHIRLYHSLDVLLMEIWKVVFWFHPLVYLLRKELILIHEYQADRAASQQGEQHNYIQLLLSQHLGQPLQLSHSFFQIPLKNRIMMLRKKPPSKWTNIKYICLLPVIVGIFFACTSEVEYTKVSPDDIAETSPKSGDLTKPGVVIIGDDFTETIQPDIAEYVPVDIEPKPLNMREIKKRIGYPKLAREAGIEGSVVVRIMVDETGNPIEYKIIQEDDPILTKAVNEHITELTFEPAQKEGKAVKFWVNIPFNFKLLN